MRSVSYEEAVAAHEWHVPERYNIAPTSATSTRATSSRWSTRTSTARSARCSWGELQDLVEPASPTCCATHGVERGDRVAVVLPPTPETAAVFFGTWKLGAILLSMSVLYGDDGIRHRLSDSEPKVLVTDAANAGRVRPRRAGPVLDDGLLDGAATDVRRSTDTAADDPAQLYYTSGTTGLAKGIVHAHRYLLAHEEFVYCHEVQDGERFHGMGEWAWAAGIAPLLGPWRLGAVQCVYQREGGFDPHKQLDFLSRHEVTNVFTTPTAMRSMMSHRRRRHALPAAVPPRLLGRRAAEPRGDPLVPRAVRAHGARLLRAHRVLSAVANYPFMEVREGSMGRPMPGWDVQILDEDEQPGARRASAARSACARARTRTTRSATGATRRRREETFGGEWFHTKDAAAHDEDGYVWYEGRADDVIIAAGYRIGPFEVESACLEHPAVARGGRGRVARRAPRQRRQGVHRARRRATSASDELAEEIKGFVRDRLSRLRLPAPDRVRRRPAQDAHRQDPPDRAAPARDRESGGR